MASRQRAQRRTRGPSGKSDKSGPSGESDKSDQIDKGDKSGPASRTFRATIYRDGSMCFIPVTFDPREVFGKVRAPVQVTLNGYTYRSTIASMGDGPCLPLRRSNREAAGLAGGETLDVTLTLDTEAREVEAPADLLKAMRAAPAALARWAQLSYSHKREHADAIAEAKRPETRARRIEAAVAMLAEKASGAAASAAAARASQPNAAAGKPSAAAGKSNAPAGKPNAAAGKPKTTAARLEAAAASRSKRVASRASARRGGR